MIRILALLSIFLLPICSYGADIQAIEREGLILRAELNNLDEPSEKEEILKKIIERCKGTEEGERAYWDLADLYLEEFPTEMRKEACETLEQCLKNYPNSVRSGMVKCKLIELYDAGNSRRSELVRQIKNDARLPNVIKSTL